MQKPYYRRQSAHQHVYIACLYKRALFDKTAGGMKALGRLRTSLDVVDRLGAAQQTAVMEQRAATAMVRALRRAIRQMLTAMCHVSALVNLEEPSAQRLTKPPVKSDLELMVTADAMLQLVTPFAKLYLAEGLPEHVLTDLPARMAALDRAREQQTSARADYTAATEGVLRALREGDAAIKVLESIIVTSNPDPGDLAMFRVAKRVGGRAKHRPSAETPSPGVRAS